MYSTIAYKYSAFTGFLGHLSIDHYRILHPDQFQWAIRIVCAFSFFLGNKLKLQVNTGEYFEYAMSQPNLWIIALWNFTSRSVKLKLKTNVFRHPFEVLSYQKNTIWFCVCLFFPVRSFACNQTKHGQPIDILGPPECHVTFSLETKSHRNKIRLGGSGSNVEPELVLQQHWPFL